MADKNLKPAGSEPGGLVQSLKYMHLAFVLPTSAVAGWFLGGLIDGWLKTTWIAKAGVILGVVAGVVEVSRMILRIRREMQ
ncbi:MAG: AtpZ/AtpI family protein [Acidobacteriales bacterium]|nr:AtpZ/AtpI family protein [Terriglobales bacterium]